MSEFYTMDKRNWKNYSVVLSAILLSLFGASYSFAHGEDKPGPHGGVIRMPGAFHTELKQEGVKGLRVYLLDMEWKNPVTENTSLEVALKRGAKKTIVNCKISGSFYECALARGVKFKKGDEFIVKARRGDAQGAPIAYAYPFLPTPVAVDEHSGHHH
jgi:hypothetical protein